MTQISAAHDPHQEVYARTVFGFWLYLMTDCILFATLFAAYAVLHTHTYGGPSARELFSLPYALGETLMLLASSFTCGLAMLFAHRLQKNKSLILFAFTFLLGLSFLWMEGREFAHLIQEGNSWQKSAFLSSYFTLVGTHGLHIISGLLWIAVMFVQIVFFGFSLDVLKRLMCLSLFWHFLDVIWIFIFTVVYLMGALP